MVFSSHLFLFLFLPLFLLAYYAVPERVRSPLILAFSIVFYGWWRPDFLGLLAACLVISYVSAHGVIRAATEKARSRWMAAGVTLDIALLGYFKYANFAVSSFNDVRAFSGAAPVAWIDIVLPIGLSFYIFQAISYVVDVYRGDARPAKNFIDFAAFITMFPQLVAGPVLRFQDVADQFRSRTHSFDKFSRGALRFMIGLCRKVLIADSLAPVVAIAFGTPNPTLADAWIGVGAYTIQLFFDFCGYSDMALGLGLMMGFEFPENFRDPYISRSITEFWRRWHISLSTWLREYLYIPLGGNRRGVGRTYFNLLTTMVLGGLWHGANWTFVLWGTWHGGVLALERAVGADQRLQRKSRWYSIPRTMLLVMIGWVMFRAHSVNGAFVMYRGMLGLNGVPMSPDLAWRITPDRIAILLVGFIVVYAPLAWAWLNERLPRPAAWAHATFNGAVIPLFLWAVATLSAQAFTPFLYYQF